MQRYEVNIRLNKLIRNITIEKKCWWKLESHKPCEYFVNWVVSRWWRTSLNRTFSWDRECKSYIALCIVGFHSNKCFCTTMSDPVDITKITIDTEDDMSR